MLLDSIFSKLTPTKTSTIVDIPTSPLLGAKASNDQDFDDEPMLNDEDAWSIDVKSAFEDEPIM